MSDVTDATPDRRSRSRSPSGSGSGPESTPPVGSRRWLLVRARVLGSAVAVGLVAGAGLTGTLTLAGSAPADGADTVVAVGAVVLGFATVGWAGSALLGRDEGAVRLVVSSEWTEAGSRRAMTRLAGLGAGAMLGATAVGLPFY